MTQCLNVDVKWVTTGIDKNICPTITAALYVAIFIGRLTCLLSEVQVQTIFIFVVKSLYFQNDWFARKTINHLTQDFGKKEI